MGRRGIEEGCENGLEVGTRIADGGESLCGCFVTNSFPSISK